MPDRSKILVVDDEPMIVATLTTILRTHGFDAYGACSGQTAILTASASHPDFLLTDVMMPDQNGIEVATAVQTLVPECIVILFSGNLDAARSMLVAQGNGTGWELLGKPIDPKSLLAKLTQLRLKRKASDSDFGPSSRPAREA